MHQTPFQTDLWLAAKTAHAAGDRADARILLKMIEAVDADEYAALPGLVAALRPTYRERLGRVPASRGEDIEARSPGARSTGAARAADARE